MEYLKLFLRAVMPMWIIFVIHVIVMYTTSVYLSITWFDDAMHAAGGAATAWAVSTLLDFFLRKNIIRMSPAWVKVFFIVGCVALVGIFWEVYEFLHDIYFPSFINQPSIRDTIGDLVLDVLGAFIFSLVFLRRMK